MFGEVNGCVHVRAHVLVLRELVHFYVDAVITPSSAKIKTLQVASDAHITSPSATALPTDHLRGKGGDGGPGPGHLVSGMGQVDATAGGGPDTGQDQADAAKHNYHHTAHDDNS